MRSWNLEFQLLHLYIEKSTFPNKKSWMAELAKAPVFYHAEGCGFDPHDRRIPFLLHFCPRVGYGLWWFWMNLGEFSMNYFCDKSFFDTFIHCIYMFGCVFWMIPRHISMCDNNQELSSPCHGLDTQITITDVDHHTGFKSIETL